MKLGAVIAAAGLSSRMGDFKPLLPMGGASVIENIIKTLRASGAEDIVVVTGFKADKLEARLRETGVIFVKNERYAETQMLCSVKLGFSRLLGQCDRLLFTPADVPLFTEKTIRTLLMTDCDAAIPVCGGRDGHPLLLKAEVLPRILEYSGEGGLHGALEHCGGRVERVPVNDLGAVSDMDTPEDYRRLLRGAGERTLWLLRHGEPEFSGARRVLGRRSDPGLSEYGAYQAEELRELLADKDISAVYCSPLSRSRETAEIIAGGRLPVIELAELTELDMGAWDGLDFDELRARFPELYEKRGRDNSVTAPGGEPLADAALRLESALLQTEGSCAVVSHAGAIRALLCRLTGASEKRCFSLPQPYGCYDLLHECGGELSAKAMGRMPRLCPTERELRRFYSECGTPENVARHCRAVSKAALELYERLMEHGHALNSELIRSAALLHDLCRTKPGHAEAGAEYLRKQGYPELAGIVSRHHALPEECALAADESAVVFLADKLVMDERLVTLEERFAASSEKCRTPEAVENSKKQYAAARAVLNRIEQLTCEV